MSNNLILTIMYTFYIVWVDLNILSNGEAKQTTKNLTINMQKVIVSCRY